MSETGRKMDVEDVLSSIRRLVSEEARTVSDTDNTPENTKNTDPNLLQQSNEIGADKLVLTPSLRVSEAISPAPVAAELEQRIADIESLVMSEAVANPQPDMSESVDHQDPLDAPMMDAAAETETFAQAMEDTADGNEDETHDATSEMMSALHLSMQDFVRAEPPLTANVSSAPNAEELAEETVEQSHVSELDDTPDDHDAIEEAEFTEIDDIAFPSDSPFEADLDAETPAPEFMQQTEPESVDVEDIVEAEEPVKQTIIDREPPLSAPQAEPAAAVARDVFEEPLDYTGDDGFLDEESLREMVSEMVRSELQGELGDRITRNVRKLVRREIHRALASRDFE